MSRVSLHRVLDLLGKPEIPADGNFDVTATVSGTTENVMVDAKLTATDLQAYDETFGAAEAQASFQNQIVQLDSLTLHKPGGGDLQASGRYEIASRSFVADFGRARRRQRKFAHGGETSAEHRRKRREHSRNPLFHVSAGDRPTLRTYAGRPAFALVGTIPSANSREFAKSRKGSLLPA